MTALGLLNPMPIRHRGRLADVAKTRIRSAPREVVRGGFRGPARRKLTLRAAEGLSPATAANKRFAAGSATGTGRSNTARALSPAGLRARTGARGYLTTVVVCVALLSAGCGSGWSA